MGWTKTAEDNREALEERWFGRGGGQISTAPYYPGRIKEKLNSQILKVESSSGQVFPGESCLDFSFAVC